MMNGHRRRKRLFKVIRFIASLIFIRKFNLKFDRIDVKGPYILVSNHNTNFDPVFLGLAEKDFVYFVATENLTRMGFLSKFVDYCFHPIIHHKGKKGINTVKEMLSYLKQGYNVGLFPEGNRSFNGITCDFVSTIGKVVKKSGASLVTYRLVGGYFTQPRWSTTLRKGKITGELVNVYTPDILSGLDEQQINTIIKNDIFEDAYLEQDKNPQKFLGKKLAYGLESTLFMCPKCSKIGTLHSDDDFLFCSECDYRARYDDYGYVGGETITQLDLKQHDYLNMNDISFSDDVTVNVIGEDHSVINSYYALLSADSDGIYIDGEKLAITGLGIHTRNTLLIYTEDVFYNIKGDIGFNALKYKYLHEKI